MTFELSADYSTYPCIDTEADFVRRFDRMTQATYSPRHICLVILTRLMSPKMTFFYLLLFWQLRASCKEVFNVKFLPFKRADSAIYLITIPNSLSEASYENVYCVSEQRIFLRD